MRPQAVGGIIGRGILRWPTDIATLLARKKERKSDLSQIRAGGADTPEESISVHISLRPDRGKTSLAQPTQPARRLDERCRGNRPAFKLEGGRGITTVDAGETPVWRSPDLFRWRYSDLRLAEEA